MSLEKLLSGLLTGKLESGKVKVIRGSSPEELADQIVKDLMEDDDLSKPAKMTDDEEQKETDGVLDSMDRAIDLSMTALKKAIRDHIKNPSKQNHALLHEAFDTVDTTLKLADFTAHVLPKAKDN